MDTILSLDEIASYYLTIEEYEAMKNEDGIFEDKANTILEKLKNAKDEVDNKVQDLEDKNPDYATPITFDIGIKDAFLEVEQEEETKQFYSLSEVREKGLLVLEVLVGALGRWNLISSNDPKATWNKIKEYFSQEMGDKISGYFLKKVKDDGFDFSAENIFKLKQLMKGKVFDEEGMKDSGLIEVLYLAIVDPLLKSIGITEPGTPFFVWSVLGYESIMLQIGIDNLAKDLEK
jgi:hypothetical protein